MAIETFDSIAIRDRLDIKNGKLKIVDAVTANASNAVTISSVAPAAVGTATITSWLEIDIGGTPHFIPLWT